MAAQGTAIIDFGTGATDASVTVTGQGAILAGSLVEAWIFPVATANNTVDDHMFESFAMPMAYNVIAGTGFTISLACTNGLAVGQYTVAWVWN